MTNFAILILGLSIFSSVGCGGTKRVAEPEMDGAAISETGEVTAVEEKETRKIWKSKRAKKREEEEAVAALGEEVLEEEEAGSAKPAARPDGRRDRDSLDSASEALRAAKVHLELGDYDFAGDELRKIGPGSALYEEAQRLLEEYR